MFKIVQTLERGKKELTIVPGAWERSGILFWPKNRADKLIKIISSMPESNWFEMPCVLKGSNLLDIESAEKELEKMLNQYDTEDDHQNFQLPEHLTVSGKKSRVRIPKRSEKSSFDVNDLVLQTSAARSEGKEAGSASSIINNLNKCMKNNIYIQDSRILNTEPGDFVTLDQETLYTPNILENSILLDENKLNEVYDQLNMIKENQAKIMYTLARFETLLDIVASKAKTSSASCSCNEKNTGKSVSPINVINSLEDLDELEENLKNRALFDEYVDRMTIICGKNGKGKGVDICYILVDIFFDRKFLIHCSWAGGSREKNKEKIPFKMYKNVINLFFNIVHSGDNEFTLEQCHEFFKNIIRNAVKRSQSSILRTSRSKRRQSKLCYTKRSSQLIIHSSINEDIDLIDTNGNEVRTEILFGVTHDDFDGNSLNDYSLFKRKKEQ